MACCPAVAPGSAGRVGLPGLAPGMCWLQTIQLLWTRAIAERGHIDQADDL
jgi:hypothetical protein